MGLPTPKLVLSPLLAAASGSVGTLTVSRNHYGYFWRERVTPTNTFTTLRAVVRSRFAAAAAYWRDRLTVRSRARWRAFARVVPTTNRIGNRIWLSGYGWFMKINVPRRRWNLPYITLPPDDRAAAAMSIVYWKVTNSPSVVQYSWPTGDAWYGEAGAIFYLQLSAELPSSVNSFQPPWVKAYYRSTTGSAVGTFGISPARAVGSRTFLRYRIQRPDGRLSPWAWDSQLVQ